MRFLEQLAKNLFYLFLVFIIPLAIATNPNKIEYAAFAASKFNLYAREAICGETPFSKECTENFRQKLDQDSNYIQKVFLDNTNKTNLYIFSIYTTKLSIKLKVKDYKKQADFLAIGIFQNFIVLQKPYWEDLK